MINTASLTVNKTMHKYLEKVLGRGGEGGTSLEI